MEQPGVVAGNFAPSFPLNFLSIFVHISGSIQPVTLIWASLERCFPPAQVERSRCQFWSREMSSEVEERPRLITAGYGRQGSQWVQVVGRRFLLKREKYNEVAITNLKESKMVKNKES